jgi:hypothetical protein
MKYPWIKRNKKLTASEKKTKQEWQGVTQLQKLYSAK